MELRHILGRHVQHIFIQDQIQINTSGVHERQLNYSPATEPHVRISGTQFSGSLGDLEWNHPDYQILRAPSFLKKVRRKMK
jgi:hypothetical protein